ATGSANLWSASAGGDPGVDLAREGLHPLGQLLVLFRQLGVRRQQRLELVGLALDRLHAGLALACCLLAVLLPLLGRDLVAIRLPRLREQDQRRGIGGLRREREVEEDEGIGVPVVDDGN